ncbi:MAG: radical SAM protein [Spirochaetes bacterium]|nr:radical SAM protein [Spirochaetota bacterium]
MTGEFIFGPVNSRRLGISLGIDLLPYKTCSFDCVYCECGLTTDLTFERAEYVKTDQVIKDLRAYLEKRPELDYITFSGSGEPTLHTGIGRIISFIKDEFPEYKVAVLTNSSLLFREDVQNDIIRADLVVPSLDAVTEEVFNKILRPADGLNPELILSGIKSFREKFRNRLVIEIFIIPGFNDTIEEISLIKEFLINLNADGIQLNSLDRPAPEEWVKPVSEDNLIRLRDMFKPLVVQIIRRARRSSAQNVFHNDAEDTIIAVLKRRPSTLDDLVYAAGINAKEITVYLEKMRDEGVIIEKKGIRGLFYRISNRN